MIQDLYGIGIRTPWPVDGVPARTSGAWDVEFIESDAGRFTEAHACIPADQRGRWAQAAALPDGSRYRQWTDLFEFLVSRDGRTIRARALPGASREAFVAYLLVDALSYTMVRLGREPLHATAVYTDHGIVGFIGESGDGKSTLGALFVQGGFSLLTDDMLVLTEEGDGFLAHPGPPRIKLYRAIAHRIFGGDRPGVPMNPTTEKLIIPLDDRQVRRHAGPLRALYLIGQTPGGPPARQPELRRLRPAEAFPRLLAATAGHWIDEPARLMRQFEAVTRLVRRVPIKTLQYPRDADQLLAVRDAVLGDLAHPPD